MNFLYRENSKSCTTSFADKAHNAAHFFFMIDHAGFPCTLYLKTQPMDHALSTQAREVNSFISVDGFAAVYCIPIHIEPDICVSRVRISPELQTGHSKNHTPWSEKVSSSFSPKEVPSFKTSRHHDLRTIAS